MVSFVANAFDTLFSFICWVLISALVIIPIFVLLFEPYPSDKLPIISVVLVGFVALVVLLGLIAVLLDIRRCVKNLANMKESELSMKTQEQGKSLIELEPYLKK